MAGKYRLDTHGFLIKVFYFFSDIFKFRFTRNRKFVCMDDFFRLKKAVCFFKKTFVEVGFNVYQQFVIFNGKSFNAM